MMPITTRIPLLGGEKGRNRVLQQMQKLCTSGSIKLHTYTAKSYEMQLQQFKDERQGESSKQPPF